MSLFDHSTWRGDHFELLFPLLRPGGWYVIEDRAWDLPDSFQDNLRARHTFGPARRLARRAGH